MTIRRSPGSRACRGATLAVCLLLAQLTTGPSRGTERAESIRIRVGDLVFDALAAGPRDGELVLLLHGFPQTGHSFRHQLRALAGAGYRAVAPDQRGYSPGARPEEVSAYAMPNLVGDVVGMAAALGRDRFHLVGHDWGGAVAWATAGSRPRQVLSLTVLSTPHYLATGRAAADPGSDQARRTAYFEDFAAADAEERFLADDKKLLRGLLAGPAIAEPDRRVYLERLGDPESLRGALNWYRALVRARGAEPASAPAAGGPRVSAPTLYLWGSADSVFSRQAAAGTADFVAGRYQFHPLEGAGHWLAEERAEAVSRLLLDHVADPGGDLHRTSPARFFDPATRLFTSTSTPALRLQVPEGFTYLGRLGFPLKGIAWVDRHLFAELDGRRVVRMIVLQFEGLLEGADGAYRFSVPSGTGVAGSNYRFSPGPVRLGGRDYVQNTWAFDQRASAEQSPGSESNRLLRFLDGRGLVFDDAWIMSRFVRAVGERARDELILFYLVPLSGRGRELAEFPDGGPPSATYDELSSAVLAESLEIFRRLVEQ